MNTYTEEMLSKLEICCGCKKSFYFETETKTCENCKNRSKNNRAKEREQIIMCAKDGCKFKRSEENKYCMKHQIELFVDEVREEDKKMCFNYIRGCRVKLEKEYGFSKCQDCLSVDREKDKIKRNAAKDHNQTVENPNEKSCSLCCKVQPMEEFKGIRKDITDTCKNCRENNRIQDMKRDKEHRNELARVNDAKPERIEVKKEWKENNYEKVAEYCMNSRQHKLERVGVEEYLKDNAEQAKTWRENNPEKQKDFNEKRHNSYETQYDNYRRTAELKQLEFMITFDEYKEIVKNPCEYCGVIQERGFNGVDRIESGKGYVLDNCASCCKMCNYMKNTLNKDVFIRRVEHILTFNGLVEGNLFPELFGEHLTSWSKYKNSALRKQTEFRLIPTDFEKITDNPCYMCGKENTKTHRNGIDRFDNNIGYVIENCKSCCGECNYMKRNYSYDDMIAKFIMIYENNKNRKENYEKEESNIYTNIKQGGDSNQPNINIVSLVKGNKKILDQLKDERRIKKQNQREQLKLRYGDEEYKRIRAREIAEYRKKCDVKEFIKRTPEQIKETTRIRQQRFRERQTEKKDISENNIEIKEEIVQPIEVEQNITFEPVQFNKVEQNIADETKLNKLKENNRIRKQKQREREQQIVVNDKHKKTTEEIKEQNRLRKQKQRERERQEQNKD
jgi:hypothetical protein